MMKVKGLLLILVLVLSIIGYIPLPVKQTQISTALANPTPQSKIDTEEILFKALLSRVYNDFVWQMSNTLQYGKDDDTWLFTLYDATTGSREDTITIVTLTSITYNFLLLGKVEEVKKIVDTVYSLSTAPWKVNGKYDLTSDSVITISPSPSVYAYFCSLVLSLYLATKNNTYLQYAEDIINTLMQYTYYDGRISNKIDESTLEKTDTVDIEIENLFIIYGLIPLYLVTKNETYLSIAEDMVNWYMSRRTDKGLISCLFNFTTGEPLAPTWYSSSPVATSNAMLSSIVVLLSLYLITKNSTYLELAKEVADSTINYIYNPSLRGFKHSIELYTLNDAYNPGEIAFYMQRYTFGLAWLYKLTNNETYLKPLIGLCNEWWERRSQNYGFITSQYNATSTVTSGNWVPQLMFSNLALTLYQVTGNTTYLYMIRDLYLTIMPKYKAQYGFVLDVNPSTGNINDKKSGIFFFSILLYPTPFYFHSPTILTYYYNNTFSLVGLNFISKISILPTNTINIVYLNNNEHLVFDREQVYVNTFVLNITIVLGDYHDTLPHIESLANCEVSNISFNDKILSYKAIGTGTVTQVIYLGKYRSYLVDSVLKDNTELQEVSSLDELDNVNEGYYVSSDGRVYIKVNLASESEIKVILSDVQLLAPNAYYRYEDGKIKLINSSLVFYEDFNKPDILKHTWLLLNYTILRTPYGIAFNKTYHGVCRERMDTGCISLKGNWGTGYYVVKAYLKGSSGLTVVLHSDWSKSWFEDSKPPSIEFINVLATHTFMGEAWNPVCVHIRENNETALDRADCNYNSTVDEGWHTVTIFYNGTYASVYIDGNFTLGKSLVLAEVINKTFPWLSLIPCEDTGDFEPFTEEGYEVIIAYIEYYDLNGNLIFREDWSHCIFLSTKTYHYINILPDGTLFDINDGLLNVTILKSGDRQFIIPFNTTYIITKMKSEYALTSTCYGQGFLIYSKLESYADVNQTMGGIYDLHYYSCLYDNNGFKVSTREGDLATDTSVISGFDTDWHIVKMYINNTYLYAYLDDVNYNTQVNYTYGLPYLSFSGDPNNAYLVDWISVFSQPVNYITISNLPVNAYVRLYDTQGNLIASVKSETGTVRIPLPKPILGYIKVLIHRVVLPTDAVIISYDTNNYSITLEGLLDYNALTVNFTGSLYIDGITTTTTLYVKLLKPLILTKLEFNGSEITFTYYGSETINGLEYNVYNATIDNNGTLVVYTSLNASIKHDDVVTMVGKMNVSECLVNECLNITIPILSNVTISLNNVKYNFTNVNNVIFKPTSDGLLSIIVLVNDTTNMKYGLVKKDINVRYGKLTIKPIDIDNRVVNYTDIIVKLVNSTDGSTTKEVTGSNEILLDGLPACEYEIQLVYHDVVIGKSNIVLNITTDGSLLNIPANMMHIIDYMNKARNIACDYDKTVQIVDLNTKFPYSKTRCLISGSGNFTLVIYYESKPTSIAVNSNVTVEYYWSGNYLIIKGTLSSTADIVVTDLYKLIIETYDLLGNKMASNIYVYINTTKYTGNPIEAYLMPENYVIKPAKIFNEFKLVNASEIYVTIVDHDVLIKLFYKVPTKIVFDYRITRETNYTISYKIFGYLKDYYDNPLENRIIYIIITNIDTGGSTTYNITTDTTGYFETEVLLAKGYNYKLKLSYSGDDVYLDSSYLISIKLKEEVIKEKEYPTFIIGVLIAVIAIIIIAIIVLRMIKKVIITRPKKYIKIREK